MPRRDVPLVFLPHLREAYAENLKLALRAVEELLRELLDRGVELRPVVGSDHGELLGEDGLVGHTRDHPLLRVVPWLEVDTSAL